MNGPKLVEVLVCAHMERDFSMLGIFWSPVIEVGFGFEVFKWIVLWLTPPDQSERSHEPSLTNWHLVLGTDPVFVYVGEDGHILS